MDGRRCRRDHPSQQRHRPGLVEHLVEVAALRALHARRAAVRARAALEHARGVLDPALEGVEAALGDADAAGVAVVDEDGRAVGLEVDVGREPADVPAVAHRPERKQRDHRVLGGVERSEQLGHLLQSLELLRLGQVPDRLGLEARLGQVELDGLERRLVADRLLLIRDDSLRHGDAAEVEVEPAAPLHAQRLLDRGVRLLLRLRVVVALVRGHDAVRAWRSSSRTR